MNKKDRYKFVLGYFQNEMPVVTTELEYGSVFQLLVAVILSAQCTDKRVNIVTPALFERYPDAKSMAESEPDEVYEYIKSISYPNSKARHLTEMSRILVEKYNSEVPKTFEELLKLPGVGRKTANVIQAVAYGRSAIAVDTHVFRVSHRLGLVSKNSDTPLKVENELMKNIPELNSALKTRKGRNQCMYSFTKGKSRAELPNHSATFSVLRITKSQINARKRVDTIIACVTLIQADFCLPCDRWIEATTDAPTPNISPIPVLSRNSGAVMFTAARASLPRPCPTKIPSVITKMAENTIPSTVGRSNFLNSFGIAIFPKSILSFILSSF